MCFPDATDHQTRRHATGVGILSTIEQGVDTFVNLAKGLQAFDKRHVMMLYFEKCDNGSNPKEAFNKTYDMYSSPMKKVILLNKVIKFQKPVVDEQDFDHFNTYLEFCYQSAELASETNRREAVKQYILEQVVITGTDLTTRTTLTPSPVIIKDEKKKLTSTVAPSPTAIPVIEGVIAYKEPMKDVPLARWGCSGVWTINPDGSENTLVDPNGCVLDWLQGDQKIASIIVVDNRGKLILVNPDGSDKQKAWNPSIPSKETNLFYLIHDVKWSKDVTKFYALWSGNNPGGYPLLGTLTKLEFVNLSTSDSKEISFGEIAYFDVSPIDDRIVFVSVNYFMNTSSPTKWKETLSIMDKDGQNRQELITMTGSVEDIMDLPQWAETTLIKSPSWPPGGKSIAFYIIKAFR